jgi:branched-chain amino acid transport system ATP-binding protein
MRKLLKYTWGTALLKVNKINVFYGHFHILKNVSLRIDEGKLVGLIGTNGAGKTTTLKAIVGLVKINSGSVELLNERINGLSTYEIAKKGISLVPERRQIFPYMTVKENLEIGAFLPAAREKIDDSLDFVYQLFPILRSRGKQKASTLSGGEQQMLAIARALMSRPKVLLLDEPTAGLSPKLAIETLESLKILNKQGLTMLLVEQNVTSALQITEETYVMENGEIIMKGKSFELLNNPHVKTAYLGI